MLESPALPATWSERTRSHFQEIESANPSLDAGGRVSLFEACELLAHADVMQSRIDEDGAIVAGSQGQPVAHPLIGEVRLARIAALGVLKGLGLGGGSAASHAGRALAARRHNSGVARALMVVPETDNAARSAARAQRFRRIPDDDAAGF